MTYVFTHGTGTEADPYLVETAADLNGVRDYLSAHFKQVADIDLSGYENWEPINAFAGTYDGGGKKIENLTIVDQRVVPKSPTPKWGAGLFGFLTTSTVKLLNINLNNVSITSEISNPKPESFYYYVGALVGGIELSSGTATITNCVAKNVTINVDEMNYRYGRGIVGGLLGYISHCNVTNCGAFEVQISHTFRASAQMGTGGFIGFMEASCILTQVAATGSMIGNAGRVDGGFFGGLVGLVRVTNLLPHKIYDSYAIVKITGGSNSTVGGFFGQECADGMNKIYNDIRRCYAAGVLTGAVCKGLAGNSGSSLTDCFWDIEATGQSTSSSGTGLTTEQAKNQASYVNWDFTDVWGIDPVKNDGYPYLLWQYPDPPPDPFQPWTPPKLEPSWWEGFKLPFNVLELDEDAPIAIQRNFKEIEHYINFLGRTSGEIKDNLELLAAAPAPMSEEEMPDPEPEVPPTDSYFAGYILGKEGQMGSIDAAVKTDEFGGINEVWIARVIDKQGIVEIYDSDAPEHIFRTVAREFNLPLVNLGADVVDVAIEFDGTYDQYNIFVSETEPHIFWVERTANEDIIYTIKWDGVDPAPIPVELARANLGNMGNGINAGIDPNITV